MVAALPDAPPIRECRQVSSPIGKLDMPNVARTPTAPGLALVGDAALALADLLAALDATPTSGHLAAARLDHLRAARDAYAAELARAREEAARLAGETPMRIPAVLAALADQIGERTTLVADAVTATAPVLTHLLPRVRRSFHATASGSLGWGLGAALGIKLAAPGDEVLAVLGDGVFQFGIQALWTAAHEAIPVVVVVLNNRSYAAVKSALQRFGGEAAARREYPASDIPGARIAEIARGFGALGRRVERLEELAPALREARQHAGPAVIEVVTDPDDLGPRPT
jgi:benzoylformate decarboxylase